MPQDNRRLQLRVASKSLIALGLLGVAYIFFAAFLTTDKGGHVALPAMQQNIAGISPGESLLVSWAGQPVLIYHRTADQIMALNQHDPRLSDARSAHSTQPDWAQSASRSRHKEWFVAIAAGTDFGCPVSVLHAGGSLFQQQPWQGGFIDDCRGSRYDFAGRVYTSQFADQNLAVPEYTLSGELLMLGG
jgi:ubiquinol-cytochrome c reductase iron-sulfur subunit